MIIIPNKNEDLFVCYENVDYEKETYTTKVLNAKGEKILKVFSNIEPIENSDGHKSWYEENLLKYKDNNKYGLIDYKGNVILKAEYDNIYSLLGTQNNIIVEKDGKKGLVNAKLKKLVIAEEYASIELLSENYSDGYIVSNGEKYGIINSDGKVILECNYNKVLKFVGNKQYQIFNGVDNILINNKGEEILNIGVKTAISVSNDNYVFMHENKYGLSTATNEIKINPEYDYMKYIFGNYYIVSKAGKYGIISDDGEVKIDLNYIDISYINDANIIKLEKENNKTDLMDSNFEVKLFDVIVNETNIDNGYIRVREDDKYKYYNFKFEEISNKEAMPTHTLFMIKENGKYGYVNKNNEKVVDAIYDDAKEQNEYGYCAVKKDGVWGAIKSDGTLILEPTVNLDESLFIDFISKWHLYNNQNLNIYTK